MLSKYSWPFKVAVSEDDAPDYYTIIEQPMDLETIQSKINNKTYKSRSDFVQDLSLIADNCLAYNGNETFYGKLSLKFDSFCKRWLDIFYPREISTSLEEKNRLFMKMIDNRDNGSNHGGLDGGETNLSGGDINGDESNSNQFLEFDENELREELEHWQMSAEEEELIKVNCGCNLETKGSDCTENHQFIKIATLKQNKQQQQQQQQSRKRKRRPYNSQNDKYRLQEPQYVTKKTSSGRLVKMKIINDYDYTSDQEKEAASKKRRRDNNDFDDDDGTMEGIQRKHLPNDHSNDDFYHYNNNNDDDDDDENEENDEDNEYTNRRQNYNYSHRHSQSPMSSSENDDDSNDSDDEDFLGNKKRKLKQKKGNKKDGRGRPRLNPLLANNNNIKLVKPKPVTVVKRTIKALTESALLNNPNYLNNIFLSDCETTAATTTPKPTASTMDGDLDLADLSKLSKTKCLLRDLDDPISMSTGANTNTMPSKLTFEQYVKKLSGTYSTTTTTPTPTPSLAINNYKINPQVITNGQISLANTNISKFSFKVNPVVSPLPNNNSILSSNIPSTTAPNKPKFIIINNNNNNNNSPSQKINGTISANSPQLLIKKTNEGSTTATNLSPLIKTASSISGLKVINISQLNGQRQFITNNNNLNRPQLTPKITTNNLIPIIRSSTINSSNGFKINNKQISINGIIPTHQNQQQQQQNISTSNNTISNSSNINEEENQTNGESLLISKSVITSDLKSRDGEITNGEL
jgi:hypothetical protein